MIIGNNNNNINNKPKILNNNHSNNQFVGDVNTMIHTDPTNKDAMRDKTMAILQQRLNNGTITLDEFNKKVKEMTK